jgi:hypothetical protein
MSAFRDAMVKACVDRPLHSGLHDADAILAMPEMQAIKAHLRKDAQQVAEDDWKRQPGDVLADWGLPESVIEWVQP